MQYYSVIKKRNEVLKHATAWMNLENMQSEKKPTTVPKDHLFHLYEMSRIGEYIQTERSVVVQGWEE